MSEILVPLAQETSESWFHYVKEEPSFNTHTSGDKPNFENHTSREESKIPGFFFRQERAEFLGIGTKTTIEIIPLHDIPVPMIPSPLRAHARFRAGKAVIFKERGNGIRSPNILI
nr:5832_t:CDS:2 [Entrophospora candida]